MWICSKTEQRAGTARPLGLFLLEWSMLASRLQQELHCKMAGDSSQQQGSSGNLALWLT